MNISGSLIFSFSFTSKDKGVVIIGRPDENGKIDVINAFENEEAIELYNKLITINKKEETNV